MAEMISSRSNRSDVCIMLLGKTGHGKSATGNSILRRKHFKTSPSLTSVTKYADSAIVSFQGRNIQVVDTPGLADTGLVTEESASAAMEAFNRGVSLCPDGFHALVLVYRFGQRMTSEEKEVIDDLKEMLGANIIREYGILLFSFGDNFDEDELEMNFNDWCRSSIDGYMKELLDECDNRCVLFNNKTKDDTQLSRQVKELLLTVDRLQSKGKRYSNWVNNEAKTTWSILTKQRKSAAVIDKVNKVLGDISTELMAAHERAIAMTDAYFDGLREKLSELYSLIEHMEEPDKKKLSIKSNGSAHSLY